MQENPYHPPTPTAPLCEPPQSQNPNPSRLNQWVVSLAWAYPLAFIFALYGTWLVAWLHLGHMPRPMLDDPKSIGVLVSICRFITMLMLMGFPPFFFIGAIHQLFFSGVRSWVARVMLTLLFVLTWAAMVFFVRYDFGNVGEWFMD